MKKFKKKISKILKAFLALSLLFNNLMPLSTVFALENEEPNEEIVEKVNNDDPEEKKELEIDSEGEEGEEEKTDKVETTDEENTNEVETTGEENKEETLGEEESQVEIKYETYVDGVLYDGDPFDVVASKDSSTIEVKATLVGTDATEGYSLVINDTEYTTGALKEGVVVLSTELTGNLYGGLGIDFFGTFTNPEGTSEDIEEVVWVEYGTEADNDEALSAVNTDYAFASRRLTAPNFDEDTARSIITSVFSKVTAEYDEEGKEFMLTDSYGHCATYQVLTGDEIPGDINGDGVVDEADIEAALGYVVGEEGFNILVDMNGDSYVDELDIFYLRQLVEKGEMEAITEDPEVTIDAKFAEFSDEVKAGDEFTIQYVVTLNEFTFDGISGYVYYDEDLLEIVNAEVTYFDTGDMSDITGQFVYLGDPLKLDKVVTEDEEGNEVVTYNDVNYVLMTLTFKALAAGDATVTMTGVKYYNDTVCYTSVSGDEMTLTISESEEAEEPSEKEEPSSLSSLKIAGKDIELKDGVYEYSLSVANDVTALDLEYELANENITVTSVVAPEELAEGENTIVITLIDENGEEKTYTITVTREAKTSETTEPVNYEEPTYDDDSYEPSDVIPSDTDDEPIVPEEKDNGKLSRVIIIILILLAIAGLIYLIFKDDKDDEETKKANRDVNRLKKEDISDKKTNNDKKVRKKER